MSRTFEFETSTPSILHATIDESIPNTTALLQTLSKQLKFPSYFEMNWNALVDCLSDLHWLEPDSEVAIVHPSLPTLSTMDLETYIGYLQTALDRHPASDLPRLRVIFHSNLETAVRALLTERD